VARRNGQIFITGNSGFPKSLNIAKKLEGVTGKQSKGFNTAGGKENFEKQDKSFRSDYGYVWKPESELAKQWEGWGTALKPAHEPIVMARKPLIGTVVENVIAYGTGGINIDGCRVELAENDNDLARKNKKDNGMFGVGNNNNNNAQILKDKGLPPVGRFPANLIHDGSEEVVGLFPQTKSQQTQFKVKGRSGGILGKEGADRDYLGGFSDSGSASRFFYCAKASKSERNAGLEGFEEKETTYGSGGGAMPNGNDNAKKTTTRNSHPTVKPVALMQYLVRLVTPPQGTVLDPFMGSGTTGIAAKREGFSFIGIEREPEYVEIAKARIDSA